LTADRIQTPLLPVPPLPAPDPREAASWSGLEELRPVLKRFLMRRCRDENEAEDLIQETFVRAARYRRDLSERGRLRAWLMQIAANVFRDHVRRGQRGPALTFDEETIETLECPRGADRAPSPEIAVEIGGELVEAELLLSDLRQAVAGLRERDRMVLDSYYSGGESTAAIASRTGISPALVKVRLFRARRRLERVVRERAARRRTQRLLELVG